MQLLSIIMTTKKHFMRLAIVLIALPIFLLSVPHGKAAASDSSTDDTLHLLVWQAPTIVNAHLSIGNKDLSASRIVDEPLASFNAVGELVPFLAAEIPSLENGGIPRGGHSDHRR